MEKIYQQIVIDKTNEILEVLVETKIFEEYEIESQDFAKTYLLDKLTEKFISGKINDDNDALFDEDEFEKILKEIIAGSILYDLKIKGYIDSYDDGYNDEIFFLTEEGKKYIKDNP